MVCLGVAGVVVGGGFRSRQGGGCRGRRGVAFVVAREVAVVVVGGGFRGRQGGGFRGRQGGGFRGRQWGGCRGRRGVAFVVARGVAVVVVGGGFRGRQGWLSSSSRGWLSSSLGGCWPPSQPPTEMLAELAQVPKKHQNPNKNRGFFGKGFLFSVVISPLKKSPPLLLKKIRIFDKKNSTQKFSLT